jgi:aspartyl-tRNA(Asn)/glutamyl-tRNA(Gln) amidotransferase subunit C
MTSVVEMAPALREDVVNDGGITEKVVANAPEAAGSFFAVPKVVE